MPIVQLKYVLSFSSQDEKHPASNLIDGDGSRKWLSAPGHKTGQLEGIFQLSKNSKISNLDIGTYNVFSIQILVGCSTWASNKEYVTLLPSATFMNPMECRKANNKMKLRMFGREQFNQEVCQQNWDRIKVVCHNPFRKESQIGLSILRVLCEDASLPDTQSNQTIGISGEFSSIQKSEIEKHFFGNLNSSKNAARIQSTLTKIGAATAENGPVQEACLSRNAKLVLSATATCSPKYKVPEDVKIQRIADNKTPIRKRLTFDDEVHQFLSTLSWKEIEGLSYAEVRHKFEKIKLRKLSKEERKLFRAKTDARINILTTVEDESISPKVTTVDNNVVLLQKENSPSSFKTPVKSKERAMQSPVSALQNGRNIKQSPLLKTSVKNNQIIVSSPSVSQISPSPVTVSSPFTAKKINHTPTQTAKQQNRVAMSSGRESTEVKPFQNTPQKPKSVQNESNKILESVTKSKSGVQEEPQSQSLLCSSQIHHSQHVALMMERMDKLLASNKPKNKKRTKSVKKQLIPDNSVNGDTQAAMDMLGGLNESRRTKRKSENSDFDVECSAKAAKRLDQNKTPELKDITTIRPRWSKQTFNDSLCHETNRKPSENTKRKFKKSVVSPEVDNNDTWLSKADVSLDKTTPNNGKKSGCGKGSKRKNSVKSTLLQAFDDGIDDEPVIEISHNEGSTTSSTSPIIIDADQQMALALSYSISESQDEDLGLTLDVHTTIAGQSPVGDSYVSCPLCQGIFPLSEIEGHAAACCVDDVVVPRTERKNEYQPLPGGGLTSDGQCPICGKFFSLNFLSGHASVCAIIQEPALRNYRS